MHPVSFVSMVTGEFFVIPVALSRTFFMAEVLCTNSFTSISPFTFRMVQNICWGCKIALFFSALLESSTLWVISLLPLHLCNCVSIVSASPFSSFLLCCCLSSFSCDPVILGNQSFTGTVSDTCLLFILSFFFVVLLCNSFSRSTFEKKRHRIWSLIFFLSIVCFQHQVDMEWESDLIFMVGK